MVCDYWKCKHYQRCKSEVYSAWKFPPCASCNGFDKCSHCVNYVDCADLVVKYLPDMFRRLVKEIRCGEDTAKTEQAIKRTFGKKK